MNYEVIGKIFVINGLAKPKSIDKIEVGFTNEVYSVDDKYIIKFCTDSNNKLAFEREAVLYKFYERQMPVPHLVIYDNNKSIVDSDYMIYKKIQGENLYNVWHKLSDNQRKSLVKQLCDYLRIINDTDINSLSIGANLKPISNWKDHITRSIKMHIANSMSSNALPESLAEAISEYVKANSHVLDEQKMALVYWDIHFDNVLVEGDGIVGLIDFERTEIASIDLVLDVVKRMVGYPKKYMSEYAEQFAKAEDYSHLLDWYEEYYPELFAFRDLKTRLSFYVIDHNLKDLERWPKLKELLDEISTIVNA